MVSNAVLTTSYGPTETPPDDDERVGAVGEAARRRARTSSRSSVAMPRSIGVGRRPRSTSARRPGPLASGMPAGPSGSPGRADLVAGRQDGDARPAMDDGSLARRRPPAGRRPPAPIAVPASSEGRAGSRGRCPRRGPSRPVGTASWTRHGRRERARSRRGRAGRRLRRSRRAASSPRPGRPRRRRRAARAPVAIRTAVPGSTVDVGRDAGPRPRR